MDLGKLLGFSKKTASDSSGELAHINQEMYKKSVELAERNKMLSILRKIDEIILGSITHPEEIAQQVTSLLISELDFPIASIFMQNKKLAILKRLSLSLKSKNDDFIEDMFINEISSLKMTNILAQVFTERTLKTSNTLENVLLFGETSEEAMKLQQEYGIKSVFVYPLVVRNDVIGVMVVCLKEDEANLAEYLKDLLDRLAKVIGIAMDNAFLYNEVQMANERLKELDKMKDEFVSLASHELRTPMTAIKSYLWMALDGRGGELTEKQKYYLGRAYTSVDRLIRLVNEMLNISRIESGRITIALESVDLEKLTQEVLDEVLPHANELGVHVQKTAIDSLPQVLADADKIKEVIFNLVGNAMKFTPKDGNITVSFSRNGDMIETKITDTGTGIAPENQAKLFQKFGMLADSYTANNTNPTSGTGLGLYMCKAIVEMHKGKIWVESEGQGKGSTFIFSLKVFSEGDVKEAPVKEEGKEEVTLIHTDV